MEENQVIAHPGRDAFIQANKHLKGIGKPKDPGMAAALFLDSSDQKYPEGLIASALIYFAGVGVTRNTETASEFANEYLIIGNDSKLGRLSKEIISGSLGTQNALNALFELDKNSDENFSSTVAHKSTGATSLKAKNNSKLLIIFGTLGLITIAALALFLLPRAGGSMSLPTSQDPSSFFQPDELQDAKRKALENAGIVRTEARTAVRAAENQVEIK